MNGEPMQFRQDWSDMFPTSSMRNLVAAFHTDCSQPTVASYRQVYNELLRSKQKEMRMWINCSAMFFLEHWFDFGNISDL